MHLLSLLLPMFIFPAASVITEAVWRGGEPRDLRGCG
jgi:hypothetical protein